ncbi:endoplasmic reticulum vesicle protein 25, partial [Gaeumannomyces tritici R3-111a-1]
MATDFQSALSVWGPRDGSCARSVHPGTSSDRNPRNNEGEKRSHNPPASGTNHARFLSPHTAMALPLLPRPLLRYICSIVLFVACANALKFELQAQSGHGYYDKQQRCIRNFVAKDTLVVVTAIVNGHKGDGMIVNMNIKDAVGNEYGRAKDIVGEQRTVFTSHADAAFDICFENVLEGHKYVENPVRSVELDVDIGADAKDWSSIQATEKLKPVETELRRIEEMVSEIVNEMDYLRIREQKLRDTNESTNTRVKWFGMLTTFLLIGLWGWQIMYLRAYFRSKHLI